MIIKELVKVITVALSYIEKRENELKHRIKVAEREVRVAEREAKAASEEADFAKGLLKEIAEDDDIKLNDAMMKKILSVTSKM